MSTIHEKMVELLNGELASFIDGEPNYLYDGVQAKLKSGQNLQIIYPNNEEYIFSWEQGGVARRIDTAPLHKELPTYPNHFHNGDEVSGDAVTSIKNSPEENLKKVLEFIAS